MAVRAAAGAVAERAPAGTALAGIALGGVLHVLGFPTAGDAAWGIGAAVMLLPLTWSVLRTLAHRDVGVDAIALVAIVSALVLGQYLVGAVVALMLAGGNALELYATRRARRELTLLVERAPRNAHRRRGELIEEIPVGEAAVGDVLVVRAGEVLPVDGRVESDEALVDESTLTGEPLPVTYGRGASVRSGTANAGDVFELLALRPAADSAYAALVRLVHQAETQQAPLVRVADRYAAIFLPVTLAVAGAAWAASGSALRGLAVLVVATPCPLILAAPIAFIAGVSRAARIGVIVKGAAVIERLGGARTVLLDKTGTVTLGAPGIERVVAANGMPENEILRLAASVDQVSAHALAEALVHGAKARGLALSLPGGVVEGRGQGIEGVVDGRRVAAGSAAWLRDRGYADAAELAGADDVGRAQVLVGVDGGIVGTIVLADHLRADAGELVPSLRKAGIVHIALVTGDRAGAAEETGAALGVDRVHSAQSPGAKLELVRSLHAHPELQTVVMVGDGVNDAPALALADVGIALATAGATVSSETADAVIVGDEIGRVADAIQIGRRSLKIARQSVLAGIGLSVVAMGFAAFGFIPPVQGALLQEAIDVAVIVNALRALRA